MSTDGPPMIAILGDVNHGKSSVVATLAEDDSVRIGPFPTTTQCQRFRVRDRVRDRDLFKFVDTPGFQNAREALPELRAAASHTEPLAVFHEFVARHKDERFFVHECRLFEPVLEGAALLYVVDIAHPMEPRHDAEMEILRLTGAPRIALLNCTGEPKHRAAWEARLRQHFNAVIDFNAHRADFANRIELLRSLALVHPAGQVKLRAAIEVLLRDREEKLGTAARIIVDLLADLLACRLVDSVKDPAPSALATQRATMEREFREKIATREAAAHRDLVKTFAHRLVTVAGDGQSGFLQDGRFVEKTWSLLGLRGWRLLTAGAGGGALVGAKVDLMLGGATWGLGAAIGASLGGGVAFAGSHRAPNITVKLPFLARVLVGNELTAGPITNPNFPWVILDRALGVFLQVSHRAHARRDQETLDAAALAGALTARQAGINDAPESVRHALAKAASAIRKNRFDPERRETAVAALQDWLRKLSE
jgi:hypothetical protein